MPEDPEDPKLDPENLAADGDEVPEGVEEDGEVWDEERDG